MIPILGSSRSFKVVKLMDGTYQWADFSTQGLGNYVIPPKGVYELIEKDGKQYWYSRNDRIKEMLK